MAQQSQGTAHQRAQKEHPTLKSRRFGRTGWKVSEIGYGMWGMGGWTGSDEPAIVDAHRIQKLRGLLQGALHQSQAALGLLAQRPVESFALVSQGMQLIGNGE